MKLSLSKALLYAFVGASIGAALVLGVKSATAATKLTPAQFAQTWTVNQNAAAKKKGLGIVASHTQCAVSTKNTYACYTQLFDKKASKGARVSCFIFGLNANFTPIIIDKQGDDAVEEVACVKAKAATGSA